MKRRLIINADDLGYDPAVTRGILESMDRGIVTSATFMVNTPFSAEAAKLAKGKSLGLHFNLGRGVPLAIGVPEALLDAGQLVEARAGQWPAAFVEAEVNAQLDELRALTGREATHVDVHKHLHLHAGILEGLCAAARGRGLPVRSISAEMRAAISSRGVKTNPHFIGAAGREAYWTLPTLRAELEKLPEGITELMCHPGYAPSHLQSGYSTQREVELATFTAPEARELVARLGVELVDFRAL